MRQHYLDILASRPAGEGYDAPYTAIQREKNIKHWPRAWKTRLIFQSNPTWRDLYEEIAAP